VRGNKRKRVREYHRALFSHEQQQQQQQSFIIITTARCYRLSLSVLQTKEFKRTLDILYSAIYCSWLPVQSGHQSVNVRLPLRGTYKVTCRYYISRPPLISTNDIQSVTRNRCHATCR